MKPPKRFVNAVNALIQAYFNDTLIPTDCASCAVGNIVAYNNSCKLIRIDRGQFKTDNNYNNRAWFSYKKYNGEISLDNEESKHNVESTGYSNEELLKVENIFMNSCLVFEKDPLYKGLIDVIDYLCKLDNIDQPEDYKVLLNKEELKLLEI